MFETSVKTQVAKRTLHTVDDSGDIRRRVALAARREGELRAEHLQRDAARGERKHLMQQRAQVGGRGDDPTNTRNG